MQLKQSTMWLICFIMSLTAKAQNDCLANQAIHLKKLVETSITVNGEAYANTLSEYFVIDIKLNPTSGSIDTIDFLRKNQSYHAPHLEKTVDKIKKSWKGHSCGYERLFIPVFLLFSSAEDLSDYPPEFTREQYLNPRTSKIFVFDVVVVNIFSPVKKT